MTVVGGYEVGNISRGPSLMPKLLGSCTWKMIKMAINSSNLPRFKCLATTFSQFSNPTGISANSRRSETPLLNSKLIGVKTVGATPAFLEVEVSVP